jgi:ligand-binding sensor domain-containing protein
LPNKEQGKSLIDQMLFDSRVGLSDNRADITEIGGKSRFLFFFTHKKSVRFLLLFIYLCACLPWVHAQTPAYLHYSVQDGLPSNLVYCGLQDPNGFMWFGTDKGLACYDGTRFHVYKMKDGLPDPEVISLKMDNQGRMWIGCFQQKPCYMEGGRIISEKEDTLLAKINLKTGRPDFFADIDSSIWITQIYYNSFRIKGQKVFSYNTNTSYYRFFRFGGQLYVLSDGRLLRMRDDGRGELVTSFQEVYQGEYQGSKASGNRLVVSTVELSILLEFDGKGFKLISTVPNPVGQVFTDRSGNFWICSNKGGANFFLHDAPDLKNPQKLLPAEKVNAMFEDNQGGFWFCTADNGIIALPGNAPVKYTKADGLLSNKITSLAKQPNGTLITGDDDGNVSFLKGNEFHSFNLGGNSNRGNKVRTIVPGPADSLWICSDFGVFLKTPDNLQKTKVCHSPKYIKLKDNTLWFATSFNLGYLTPGTLDTVTFVVRRTTCIGEDNEHNMWAGGMSGLYSIKDGFKNNVGDAFPTLKAHISSIQKGEGSELWVATPGDGLLRLQVDHGRVVATDRMNDHLSTPIENIQSIYVDPVVDRRLWLSTNSGIYCLDQGKNLIHMDVHNGLADNDVNTLLMCGDTLWAGTVAGLTRFIIRNGEQTAGLKTAITRLRYLINDKSTEVNLIGRSEHNITLQLAADATNIVLELAGLEFRGRGNLNFECIRTEKMLPLLSWTPGNIFNFLRSGFSGRNDTLEITNGVLDFGYKLPAGTYRLQVCGFNTSGVKSNRPAEIALIMLPHWYETIWFWALLWGMAIAGIWRVYRNRVAFRELSASASELQLQALQAQMNPHFVGNSINAIQQFFYPPNPSKASEYIALFTRLLRETMAFSERTFIPFKEEISYDMDYLKMVQLRFGDRFRYSITGTGDFPDEMLFPAMMLQPLLENATIHGLAEEGISELSLDFRWQGGKIQVSLLDNGVGIEETLKRRKNTAGAGRISRGIGLLQKKAGTINGLYGIDLEISFQNGPGSNGNPSGTLILLSFNPWKLNPDLSKNHGKI